MDIPGLSAEKYEKIKNLYWVCAWGNEHDPVHFMSCCKEHSLRKYDTA